MHLLGATIVLLQFSGISTVFFRPGSESKLTEILLQLNTAYNTELNVFVNFQNNSEDIFNLQLFKRPQLQLQLSIKTFENVCLLGKFTEKAMVIVYIKKPPLDAAVADLLPYLLWQLHELHIVFIASEEGSDDWREDLFSYCFREGFINALLIEKQSEILSLYSYNPYPVVKVEPLSNLLGYRNRSQHLKNFQGLPIRTLLFTIEPRIIQYVNRQGKVVFAGYMYDAFLEFIRRHNATLKFIPELPKPGAFGVAVELMARKGIDFACYPKEINWNITSTAPVHLLKEYIVVPHARPIASYLYFARPFTWTLWLAIIGTVGYCMTILYGSYGVDRDTELSLQFLSSWCHLLFLSQPGLLSLSNWQQIVIHFILTLSGFILTNMYLALLSSMLTSGLFERQYNTLEDLVDAPYPLLVDSYYAKYLQKGTSLPEAVLKRLRVASAIDLDTARNGLNTSFMYTAYEDRMEGILYQQHLLKVPRFKMLPQCIMDGLMSFPVPPGLPYLTTLNGYMRSIFEHGILAKMKSDAWRDTINSGMTTLMRGEGVEQKPYDLEFYFYAFLLWALGLTLAGIAFLLELLRAHMNKKQNCGATLRALIK